MEKVKDLTKVILSPSTMLGEVIKPKRYILMPDGSQDDDSYIVVISKHDTITDINAGDIIIKYGGQMTAFKINDGRDSEKTYVIMNRGAVLVAVSPENFIDPDKLTERVSV